MIAFHLFSVFKYCLKTIRLHRTVWHTSAKSTLEYRCIQMSQMLQSIPNVCKLFHSCPWHFQMKVIITPSTLIKRNSRVNELHSKKGNAGLGYIFSAIFWWDESAGSWYTRRSVCFIPSCVVRSHVNNFQHLQHQTRCLRFRRENTW